MSGKCDDNKNKIPETKTLSRTKARRHFRTYYAAMTVLSFPQFFMPIRKPGNKF